MRRVGGEVADGDSLDREPRWSEGRLGDDLEPSGDVAREREIVRRSNESKSHHTTFGLVALRLAVAMEVPTLAQGPEARHQKV